MMQHFTDLGVTPFWHLCVPKGAELPSLRGGVPFAPLPAGFRRSLSPPPLDHRLATCLWTCQCNQLHGLCYKKGLFHGMQHSFHCSILTWMQPALEHCDTPDLPCDHVLPHCGVAAGHLKSLSKVHLKPFGDFSRTPTCASMLFVREFRPIDIVISFVSPVSPSTEERLQDGGDSACGRWFVCFGWFGCPRSFLHHLTVLPFLQR